MGPQLWRGNFKITDFGIIDLHVFFCLGLLPQTCSMLAPHEILSIFFLHFLLPMMDFPLLQLQMWSKTGQNAVIAGFLFFISHLLWWREKKGTGEHRDQNKTVLSVIGKSVRRKEPLLLSRVQLWRSLSANSATTAMPCEGHSLLQLAAEILPTLNLSITSNQCVIALIKLSTPKGS